MAQFWRRLVRAASGDRGPDPQTRQDNSVALAVDFAGELPPPPKGAADTKLAANTHMDNATLLQRLLERNEAIDGWRLSLVLRRTDAAKPVEIRAQLARDNQPVSETWSYILPPE